MSWRAMDLWRKVIPDLSSFLDFRIKVWNSKLLILLKLLWLTLPILSEFELFETNDPQSNPSFLFVLFQIWCRL